MSLKSIQLCHMDPSNKGLGLYTVTCNSDDGHQLAVFDCDSEEDARALRNAIREHAAQLRCARDYRPSRS